MQELEYYKKLSLTDIEIKKNSEYLSNSLKLDKYQILSGIVAGIKTEAGIGSSYIDFYKDNIVLLSSRGVIAFSKNFTDKEGNLIQIRNNIEKFIGLNQFRKYPGFSLKDLLIKQNKIYVSYTEEIQTDCWNTSVLEGDFNFENIKFKNYSPQMNV